MDEVVSALSVRGLAVEQARTTMHDRPKYGKVDKWSVKRGLSEWYGTEVQIRYFGVIYGGFLWGV